MQDLTRTVNYPAGKILISEGSHGRKMFILKVGKVRVFKEYLGQKVTLAILGPGEMFGELSFFDASPRSASVESITPIDVMVIEANDSEEQIKNLPSWVSTIFKTVFYRFREMDEKLTLYQAMHDFQRKFTTSIVAEAIYVELKRYNQVVEILFESMSKEKPNLKYDDFYQRLDFLLGKQYINLKIYLKVLFEQGFIEKSFQASVEKFEIKVESFHLFNKYIEDHLERKDFVIFSQHALQLIKAMMGYLDPREVNPNDPKQLVQLNKSDMQNFPFFEEGLDELTQLGIVKNSNDGKILVSPKQVHEYVMFQPIIKSFDRKVIHLEG